MKSAGIKIVSLILTLVTACSLSLSVSAYSFASDWAKKDMDAMDQLGLIPESLIASDLRNDISRLDMAKSAVLAYEKITRKQIPLPESHPFTDTQNMEIEKAFTLGIFQGDGNGICRPHDSLIRVEFFAIVIRFLKAAGYEISSNDLGSLESFSDAASLPNWSIETTKQAVGLKIVQGNGAELDWESTTSCQEAFTMFYRAYQMISPEPAPQPTVPESSTSPSDEPTVPDLQEPDSEFIQLASWAKESIMAMNQLGLIPSQVKSLPMNEPITRLNMCRVIMAAYKQLTGVNNNDLGNPGDSPFIDTDDLDVLYAAKMGLVKGMGNHEFRPEQPISRQDFFTMSVRFLNQIGYLYEDDETMDLKDFHDYQELSGYAAPPTRLLLSIGSVTGDDTGHLNPAESIASQEALVVFYRIHHFVTTWVASDAEDHRTEISRDTITEIIEMAKKYLGYDYVYGGKSPETGFDCSGYVYYIYKQFGYDNLTPGAGHQWYELGAVLDRESLLPGDLVFFSDNGEPSGMTHVAIYIGDGQIIHASTPSTGVIISDLNEPYYVRMYLGAKRVIE